MTPTIKNVKKMEKNNKVYLVVRLNKNVCFDESCLFADIVSWHFSPEDCFNVACALSNNDNTHRYIKLDFDLLTDEMRNASKDKE